MPLFLGAVWAAIFIWLFFRARKTPAPGGVAGPNAKAALIYLVVGLIGLAIGAWFTFGSGG